MTRRDIARLVDVVQGYLASHGDVGIQLGRAGVDFAVTTGEHGTAQAQSLWSRITRIPTLVNAIVTADHVHARTLRPGTADALYTLYEDGSFEVIQYETPAAELVGVVTSAPAAMAAPFIRVEGADVAVGGSLAELTQLVSQGAALATTSDQFTKIELNSDGGSLALDSPVATDPDIPAAVACLRASGAADSRTFIDTYLQTKLNIVGGVATVADDYTDGHVVEAFAAAWNAG